MTIWSNGDVSGSQTLTDNDHLYPAHINELRTAVNTNETDINTLETAVDTIELVGTEVGGVIRPDASGTWYILNDSGHKNLHLVSISQTADHINVTFDVTFSKIRWAAVTPDETLIGADINCGASVNTSDLNIYMASAGTIFNPNLVGNPASNIWIYVKGII